LASDITTYFLGLGFLKLFFNHPTLNLLVDFGGLAGAAEAVVCTGPAGDGGKMAPMVEEEEAAEDAFEVADAWLGWVSRNFCQRAI
jgi:hypothetical protein